MGAEVLNVLHFLQQLFVTLARLISARSNSCRNYNFITSTKLANILVGKRVKKKLLFADNIW